MSNASTSQRACRAGPSTPSACTDGFPTVEEVTGRRPRAFAEWARATVDRFR